MKKLSEIYFGTGRFSANNIAFVAGLSFFQSVNFLLHLAIAFQLFSFTLKCLLDMQSRVFIAIHCVMRVDDISLGTLLF